MVWKVLYFFVEGPDDEDFVNAVLQCQFENRFDHIHVVKYQKKSYEKRSQFLRSIGAMPDCDYIYLCDCDGLGKDGKRGKSGSSNQKNSESKKRDIGASIPNISLDRVFIVVDCIEGWYLAGISTRTLKSLKLKRIEDTETVCKLRFRRIVPKDMAPHEFMAIILRDYSISTAANHNESFRNFAKHNGISH